MPPSWGYNCTVLGDEWEQHMRTRGSPCGRTNHNFPIEYSIPVRALFEVNREKIDSPLKNT